jgi:hypothetical protein
MKGIRWGKRKNQTARHGVASKNQVQQRTPSERSKAAVSNKGKPMMPE